MKASLVAASTILIIAGSGSRCRNAAEPVIFRAEREGAANCLTVFTIDAMHRFREKTTCFGEEEVTGDYTRSGDTLFFSNLLYRQRSAASARAYYSFAVIRRKFKGAKKDGDLLQYRYGDTTASGVLQIVGP